MKLGVLTSSRADYGIYKPLLQKLKSNPNFELRIIVFGMHLMDKFGCTINEIENDSHGKIHRIEGMPEGDTKLEVIEGYAEIINRFGYFWSNNHFDCVLALGDRWEMSAAVQASIPFEVTVAHIHGGETTLGATDNIYRHQITLASKIHFTASELFSKRVASITGSSENVFNVGSLSIEEISDLQLPDWKSVKEKFHIPFDHFILCTIHPESVNADRNKHFANIVFETLEDLSSDHNILITASNADVMGSIFNAELSRLAKLVPKSVKYIKSLGKLNYFSAIKNSQFLLGNTSSGIIEAASFKKWVINIGDRQKGRLRSSNVLDVPFSKARIIDVVNQLPNKGTFRGANVYYKAGTSDLIINQLLKYEDL